MSLGRQIFNPHKTMDHLGDDEHVICDIRRHPFGLIILYAASAFLLLFFVLAIVFFLPNLTSMSSSTYGAASIIFIVLLALLGISLFIATAVYRESRLIVTNKDITQIIQYGLFNRKMSQLSLANVEDVTSDQDGIFPTYVNYGTLKVETAGEQANFHFIFCPNPGAVASAILEAREKFLEEHGGETPVKQSALYHERKSRKKSVTRELGDAVLPEPEQLIK